MHSATTATGRLLPPPGKSLPKNRPAPRSCRPAHQPAAPKLHVTYVTSHRKCYIQAPASTRRSSRVTSHAKINRQPRRLEFTLSRTKQTPAPQINRQQITTSKITHPNRHNQNAAPAPARHSSRITRHCRSNRHTPRLENAISHRKQTLGTLSNRHFLQVSASHQRQIADVHRPTYIVSNRQWQILEIAKNPTKTRFSTVLIGTKTLLSNAQNLPSQPRTIGRTPQFAPGWLFPLCLMRNRCITSCIGCEIMLGPIKIRKILLASLVSLLLCGVVASELPELLTLTNDTSNDFTVRNSSTASLRALPDAQRPVRIAHVNSSLPAGILLHSRLVAFEKPAPVPSELLALHSILRT
jgi:hypothetical protein